MPGAYVLLCTALGLILGRLPFLVHGPVPEKYNVLYIRGAIAVWGWYIARMLIGFLVGIARWPPAWWLRGPLCGLVLMLPLGMVSLATPTCGWPCMSLNLATAAAIGLMVGGLARAVTGKDHARQDGRTARARSALRSPRDPLHPPTGRGRRRTTSRRPFRWS